MQSINYRQMLREIHGDTITWFESEEEMINHEVWRDTDTGQWRFQDKHFKREGQARKAARLHFLNKKA